MPSGYRCPAPLAASTWGASLADETTVGSGLPPGGRAPRFCANRPRMAWLIGFLAALLALGIAPLAPTCSNDASHFVLGVSLSQGRVALGEHAKIAEPDYAERDGVIYSDRAPGLAFVLGPLIWLGLDPRLLSAAAFGGTLAVLYGWLRR